MASAVPMTTVPAAVAAVSQSVLPIAAKNSGSVKRCWIFWKPMYLGLP
jgi:hypothetical protein